MADTNELPPCRACGACCSTEYNDGTVADMEEADVKRLGPRRLKVYCLSAGGTWPDEPHWATANKINRQGMIVCQALRGSVGKQCSCAIYDDRPKVCRTFKRGSRACRAAIKDAGL